MLIPSASSLLSYFDARGQVLVDRNVESVLIRLSEQPKQFFPARQIKKTLLPSGRKRLALAIVSHRVKFSLQLKCQWSSCGLLTFPTDQIAQGIPVAK